MRATKTIGRLVILPLMLGCILTSGGARADALECRHSATSAPSLRLGSQVDGNFVTICLSRQRLLTLKPSPRPAVGSKKQPRVAPWTGQVRFPAPRLHSHTIGVRFGSNGSFTPVISQPTVWPATVKPGDLVTFATRQPERFGFGHLLGRQISVRFTPIKLHWTISDGETASRRVRTWAWMHAFAKPGAYTAVLRVTYLVRFRLGQASWQTESDPIVLPAIPQIVTVGQVAKHRVVLVKND